MHRQRCQNPRRHRTLPNRHSRKKRVPTTIPFSSATNDNHGSAVASPNIASTKATISGPAFSPKASPCTATTAAISPANISRISMPLSAPPITPTQALLPNPISSDP